jgi:hypothetical protein
VIDGSLSEKITFLQVAIADYWSIHERNGQNMHRQVNDSGNNLNTHPSLRAETRLYEKLTNLARALFLGQNPVFRVPSSHSVVFASQTVCLGTSIASLQSKLPRFHTVTSIESFFASGFHRD